MQVSFYATLRKIVGQKTVEIPLPRGATLQDLLEQVLSMYPDLRDELLEDGLDENAALSRHVHLFVNGRSSKYLADGMATRILPIEAPPAETPEEILKIEFFPAVAGG